MFFYRMHRLRSPLSPEACLKRIKVQVEESKGVLFAAEKDPRKPFVGEIGEDSFKIRRKIRYTNSFLPVVTGNICENGDMACVEIRMKLHYFVIAFFIIFALAFAMVAGSGILNPKEPADLMPLLFFIGFPLIGLIVFNLEANKALKAVTRWIEGEQLT